MLFGKLFRLQALKDHSVAHYSLSFIMRTGIRRLEKTSAFLYVATCAAQVLLRLMKSQQQWDAVRQKLWKYTKTPDTNACLLSLCVTGVAWAVWHCLSVSTQTDPPFFHRWPIRSDAKMPMPAVLSHRVLGIHIMSVSVRVCVRYRSHSSVLTVSVACEVWD